MPPPLAWGEATISTSSTDRSREISPTAVPKAALRASIRVEKMPPLSEAIAIAGDTPGRVYDLSRKAHK